MRTRLVGTPYEGSWSYLDRFSGSQKNEVTYQNHLRLSYLKKSPIDAALFPKKNTEGFTEFFVATPRMKLTNEITEDGSTYEIIV